MNFSKWNLPNLKKTDLCTKAGRKLAYLCLKVFLILLLSGVVLGTAAGFGAFRGLIATAPDISSLSVAPSESATYIYNSDGSIMQKLSLGSSNRTLVTIDQIPEDLQHAVVAIEDERFYQHKGIDIRGILRAGIHGLASGRFDEGASTITQQLLKNSVFTGWMKESSLIDRFRRKFQEQYLALQLEKKVSKEQILEDYLNTINLGAGTYGVQAASRRYFGKSVSELNLSECAVLAGITQNPTRYNPITHPEENAVRRQTVLDYMLKQGYITQEAYDEAVADDVYARIQETDSQTEEVSIYTYYVDAMIDQVIQDLMEQKGYTEQQANKILFTKGLKIYSVQDMAIQKICDEEFANPANFPSGTQVGVDYALSVQTTDGETIHYGNEAFLSWYRQNFDASFNLMFDDEASARSALASFKESKTANGETILGERISLAPQPQASLVIMEQETGYVKAIVGGRGNKEASLTLNRATATTRQPGSTFKIITTYAPALDYDNMTLSSIYYNAPYTYRNGVPVNNWDSNNTYTGYTTIRDAITHSINIVAVKCLTEITPAIGFQYAERFGISTLENSEALDVSQPLALGGITNGVTNLELTGAFATIANKGQYIKPKFYSHIEGPDGEILIDNRTPVTTRVLKEGNAWLLTSAMEDVVTKGTGTLISLGDMPVAGKTGTTSDYKDIWFSGYTPYYTCSIWGGYDNNDDLPSVDGDSYHTYHKILWNAVMNRIHQDLPVKDFEQPDDIVTATICKKSGKLAIEGICDQDPRGSQVYEEYFIRGTEPKSSCDKHVSLTVCQETGLLASSTCTPVNRVFLKLPEDNFDTTDDTSYAPPTQTCPGHKPVTILDGLKDSQDSSGTTVIDPDSSETQNTERRAEEDGDTPVTIPGDGDGDVSLGLP